MYAETRTTQMALKEAKYQLDLIKKELDRIASNNDYIAMRVLESLTHDIAKLKEEVQQF